MKKGTVINLGQFKNTIFFLRKNWCVILLTVTFLIGLVFGSVIINHNETVFKWAKNFAEDYLLLRNSGGFWPIFLNSFMVSFCFMLMICVLGTSIIGVTTVPFVTAFRGACLGSLMGAIFTEYSLKGIVINALAIIPASVISVLFLIICARESMRFSMAVIKITLPNAQPKNLSYAFSNFLKRVSLLIMPIILSSVIDAWLSAKTMSFFEL